MESEPLARACELAFAVARQGVEASPPIEPPVAMRSFLYVPQLPRRAMTVAQRVVDEDPEFRARVAQHATEVNVGREGYLWLHRPNGWDSDPDFARSNVADLVTGQSVAGESSALPDLSKHAGQSVLDPMPSAPVPPPAAPAPSTARTPAPVPPPTPPVTQAAPTGAIPPPPPPPSPTSTETASSETASSETVPSAAMPSDARASIEEELASLRGLVSRLAEERQHASAPVAGLEHEVEERRAESNALASQLTNANTDIQKAREERDRAMSDREGLLSRQAELESELRSLRQEVEQSRSAIEGVEAERTDTLTTLEQAQAELAAAQRKIDEALTSEANLRTQLDAAVAERDAAWSDAASLRIERDQLGDRVRVAEQARVDLEAQLDEVSGQWQELKVDIQTLAEERRAVETALDELSKTTETSAVQRRGLFNELASQLGQVEAERDHLAAQIDIMRARITGTRSALDMATHSLSGELESAEAAANDSVAAVANLDSALGGAHERMATLGNAVGESDTPGRTASGDSASDDSTSDEAASDEAASDEAASVHPPAPPMPPTAPGTAAADISVSGFLPDGVEVESTPARHDATLFGNPRDASESRLFGDPTPAGTTTPEAEEDDTPSFGSDGFGLDQDDDTSIDDDAAIDTDAMRAFDLPEDAGPVDDTIIDAGDDTVVDDTVVDGTVVDGTVGDDTVGDDDAAIDTDAMRAFDLPEDAGPVDDTAVDGTVVDDDGTVDTDAMRAFDLPEDAGPVDSPMLGDRSSADDDQALANVMASYGFGADDDDDSPAEVVPSDESVEEEPGGFDINDTSSFTEPSSFTDPSSTEGSAPIADDTEARRVASTPDMVMLVDGDAAALMGWRDSAVLDRRRYLLEKLDQVTGEYGPAIDVVFDSSVGGDDELPAPTKVRRRLIQPGVTPVSKLSELVDSYPSHFPIAVVSDHGDLRDQMRLRSIETLEVVQLLDLIVNLPEVD